MYVTDVKYNKNVFIRNNVAACAKHFVGDGGTENGTNQGNTMIDRKGLLSIHMPPYRNAVLEGVSTVMISYSSWNFVKMHSNHDLITNYLKKKLKFNVSTINRIQTRIFRIFLTNFSA